MFGRAARHAGRGLPAGAAHPNHIIYRDVRVPPAPPRSRGRCQGLASAARWRPGSTTRGSPCCAVPARVPLMCERALSRECTEGPLTTHQMVQEKIADSYSQIRFCACSSSRRVEDRQHEHAGDPDRHRSGEVHDAKVLRRCRTRLAHPRLARHDEPHADPAMYASCPHDGIADGVARCTSDGGPHVLQGLPAPTRLLAHRVIPATR